LPKGTTKKTARMSLENIRAVRVKTPKRVYFSAGTEGFCSTALGAKTGMAVTAVISSTVTNPSLFLSR